MDNFYGGKPGQSVVLKAHFPYFDDMVDAFKKGEEYKDVWFGEYCIISCPNLNHPDNGKVYRRGFDYQQDDGDAQYIGQIRGPASGTPWFEMTNIDKVIEISKRPLDRDGDNGEPWEERSYPILKGDAVETYYDDSNTNTDPEIHILNFSTEALDDPTKDGGSLVPGKTGPVPDTALTDDMKFNDTIRYTWVNMRTADEDNDSVYYVGFEIPYTVIDFSHTVIAPYKDGKYDESVLQMERMDPNNHPFYEWWDVPIPKGIKGDSFRNLRVIKITEAHEGNKIYTWDDITVDSASGKVTINNSPSHTIADGDIGRQILVYQFLVHDTWQNPRGKNWDMSGSDTSPLSAIWVYLGDFNVIDPDNPDAIMVDDDGTLTIDMTYSDDYVFDKKIRWITDTTLDTETGKMTQDFNNTTSNPDHTWWLRWVKGIEFDMDKGTITIIYTNDGQGGNAGEDKVVIDAKLRWVKDAKVSDTGVITFGYNTETDGVQDTFVVKDMEEPTKDFHIQHIKNVYLNESTMNINSYNADKYIHVVYNYKDGVANKDEKIGSPLNIVQDMVVDPADFHLLVLFNDPEHRITNTEATSAGVGADDNSIKFTSGKWNGTQWRRRVKATNGTYTEDEIWWRDYGTIKDDHGLLVGLNIDRDAVAANTGVAAAEIVPENVISALNKLYPSGLMDNTSGDGETVRHKIVTFGDDMEEKWFFAYDYDKYTWYYLGRLTDSTILDIMILDGTTKPIPYSSYEKLQWGGTALVYEKTQVSDQPLPDFWAPDYVDTYFLDDAKEYLDALLDFSIRWHKTDGSDANLGGY